MALALAQARLAFAADEVPIGAIILAPREPASTPGPGGEVATTRILASAHNLTRADCDPTAHAELRAIQQAAARLGYLRLDGCTLYTTVEPCFMCAGAIVHARLRRVVWAVRDPKFGGAVSLGNVLQHEGANHRAEYAEGVLADQARTLMQDFFRSKR